MVVFVVECKLGAAAPMNCLCSMYTFRSLLQLCCVRFVKQIMRADALLAPESKVRAERCVFR